MRDSVEPQYKDPRKEDIIYGDRRISRPDVSLPDWEVPDTSYRPVPIVWFTGALFVELFVLVGLGAVLSSQSAWLALTFAAVATGGIGMWTWGRGMETAGTGWKIATVVMLLVQLAFFAMAMGLFAG